MIIQFDLQGSFKVLSNDQIQCNRIRTLFIHEYSDPSFDLCNLWSQNDDDENEAG